MMINKRLLEMSSESKKYIYRNVAYQWIALICNIVSITMIGILLEHIMRGLFILPMIICVGVTVVVMILIRSICSTKSAKMSYLSSCKIKLTLREQIYHKLLKLGNGYREKVSTSEIVQVSVEGVEQLEIYMGRYLPQFFYAMLAPITLFVFLMFINVKAAVALLLCVPLIPASIIAVQKFAKKLLGKYWSLYTGLGDHFLENLNGLTTLKIYKADKFKNEQMNEDAENFRKITMKVLTMQLNSITLMDLIAFGGAAIGVIIAVSEYAKGNIEFYHAFIIIMISAEFFIPMRLLGSFFHIAMNGMAACDKIFRLLDMEVNKVQESGVGSDVKDFEGVKKPKDAKSFEDGNSQKVTGVESFEEIPKIRVDQVDFSYKEGKPCLQQVSFAVKQGDFTAIVGPSGSGKSTIASILMKANTSYQGNIYIEGRELRTIPEAEIMKKITYVSFQSYIFAGTVRENLLLADRTATDKQLYEVLKKVNLYDFVMSEGGLDFVIAERGGNLSGGQRQRLSIARALLHDTDYYIFDEATSNIDATSEEIIMNVIRELKDTKTILFITHRLSQTDESTCIHVLEHGKLVQSGSSKELRSKDGLFKQMYDVQSVLETIVKEEK